MRLYAWTDKHSPFKFGAKQNDKMILLGVLPWGWAEAIYGEEIVGAVKESSFEKPCKLVGDIAVEGSGNARLLAVAADLLEACKKAVRELNEIRARDGVPYTHQGIKASVCPDYFSSVVDECFTAIANAEN